LHKLSLSQMLMLGRRRLAEGAEAGRVQSEPSARVGAAGRGCVRKALSWSSHSEPSACEGV